MFIPSQSKILVQVHGNTKSCTACCSTIVLAFYTATLLSSVKRHV
uniref:Uncharacterized protein n=1 Tax=Arundo donax TaxID=35708 RepID=A0A0A9UDG6_ARUDO